MDAPAPRTPRQPVFRVTLPLPPSVNDWLVPVLRPMPDTPGTRSLIRARMAVRGADSRVWAASVVKSKRAESWLKAARAALQLLPRPSSLHSGVLEMTVTVYVHTIASDGGNRLKLPEDAFNELVWSDDRQVVLWHIRKDISPKEEERVEIEVRKADPVAHARVAERLEKAERNARKQAAKASAAARQVDLAPGSWRTPLPPTSSPGVESYGRRHGLVEDSRPKRMTPAELKAKATSAYRPPRGRR